MTRRQLHWTAGLLVSHVLTITFTVWAAPMFNPQMLPHTTMSLAALDQVYVTLTPLPEPLRGTGIDHDASILMIRRQIIQAGFRISEEEDDEHPTLRVRSFVVTDSGVPDAMAIGINVTFWQKVYVQRLDQVLKVPTFIYLKVGLGRHDELKPGFEQLLANCLKIFTERVKQANTRR